MSQAATARSLHAKVLVTLAEVHKFKPMLDAAVGKSLTDYCDVIQGSTEPLADEDVEAIRFLSALRAQIAGVAPSEE